MKSKNTQLFNFQKIGCLFRLHRFELIRDISPEIKEVRCKICGKELGVYKNITSIFPLDQELKAAHRGSLNHEKIK